MAEAETSDSDYLAPYHRHDEEKIPNAYYVMFKKGHTVAKHFQSVGHSFKVSELVDDMGYTANVDDDVREQIRRDPGVKYVEDIPKMEDDW